MPQMAPVMATLVFFLTLYLFISTNSFVYFMSTLMSNSLKSQTLPCNLIWPW
uniref:ATP synthase F0 subunit 8 n=1 Tax=Gammarus pisinnus TaxID=1486748 RepID=A0A517LS58_9CRUS|nr:ATP synthase F0 subunit 8 [Gammarus pisinnus]QDS78466.1 ATP synthase F0 subunit 8 [Gammarus pisinnus]